MLTNQISTLALLVGLGSVVVGINHPGANEIGVGPDYLPHFDVVFFEAFIGVRGRVADLQNTRIDRANSSSQDFLRVDVEVEEVVFGDARVGDVVHLLSMNLIRWGDDGRIAGYQDTATGLWFAPGDSIALVAGKKRDPDLSAYWLPLSVRFCTGEGDRTRLLLLKDFDLLPPEDLDIPIESLGMAYARLRREFVEEPLSLPEWKKVIASLYWRALNAQADKWRRGTWSFDDVPFVPEPHPVEGTVPPGSGKGGGG